MPMDMLAELIQTRGETLHPESQRPLCDGMEQYLADGPGPVPTIVVVSETRRPLLSHPLEEEPPALGTGCWVHRFPLTLDNVERLAALAPIAPVACHCHASFGAGDRLGRVTPAHIRAVTAGGLFPVLAQQSPRELERTGRSFESVLLDAVAAILRTGWEGPWGADADHIKHEADLKAAIGCHYTMYTIDVSDWLRDASALDTEALAHCECNLSSISRSIIDYFSGHVITPESGPPVTLSREELLRSAFIYEPALHRVQHWSVLISRSVRDHDLEVSIDEGARTTTPEDHLYVAEFLHRVGVGFQSLAPRFPGAFQKGVEYRGDLQRLDQAFALHAAIARELQGYRLSLHSGSDKFSVYPAFRERTRGRFHVKTSGTSWLEAVRLIAQEDRPLLETLYAHCLRMLPEAKKAYHVDITTDHFPPTIPDGSALAFLDTPDVRQLFHISYGALLDAYRTEMERVWQANDTRLQEMVEQHIGRHIVLLTSR